MQDIRSRSETLTLLGEKFSGIDPELMSKVLGQTKIYETPERGLDLFKYHVFQKTTTPMVLRYCLDKSILEKAITIGFDDPSSQLNYSTRYMNNFIIKRQALVVKLNGDCLALAYGEWGLVAG